MKKIEKVMEMVVSMENETGLRFVRGVERKYKTGYTVVLENRECMNIEQLEKALNDFDCTCGVWKGEDGKYYVDQCVRVKTKRFAKVLAIAARGTWGVASIYIDNKSGLFTFIEE